MMMMMMMNILSTTIFDEKKDKYNKTKQICLRGNQIIKSKHICVTFSFVSVIIGNTKLESIITFVQQIHQQDNKK